MIAAPVKKRRILGVALVAIVAGTSAALAFMRGAFGTARGDDWSYLSLVLTGSMGSESSLNGWVHMMFISQKVFGSIIVGLVGPSVVSLQIGVLVLGALGLLITYEIARHLISSGWALLVVFLTGMSPLWLYLSVTFMTDILAWMLSLASLAVGVMAMMKQRVTLLLVGAVVSLFAFGVREYAAVPFLALLVWIMCSDCSKRFRLGTLITGIVMLLTCTVTYLWRQSLPGSVETVASAPLESLVLVSRLLLTLALLLAPYVALSAVLMWRRLGTALEMLRNHWIGAAVGVVLGVGIVVLSSLRLAGNVIHPYGSSWTSVGDGVRSLPMWGFRTVTLVAALCLIVILALTGMLAHTRVVSRSWKVMERPHRPINFAGLYFFITMTVIVVYALAIFLVGAPTFDRYLLLVVPLLGIVILALATQPLKDQISKFQKCAVGGILVVTGAFGIVITDGLNQVDGLRWQVASELVATRIPAYKIDGGDAWFRYHQEDAPGVAKVGSLENSVPGRTWWQTFFEGSTYCRMIAIESETDLQAMYGPALSIQEERTLLGTPFRILVFPGPDPC